MKIYKFRGRKKRSATQTHTNGEAREKNVFIFSLKTRKKYFMFGEFDLVGCVID